MKKIYYGKAVYNHKEIKAVNKVLRNNSLNLIDGPHVKKLEKIGKIRILTPYQLNSIEGDKNIKSVSLKKEDGKIEKLEIDYVLGFFGLIMKLGPIANWGLNLDKKTIKVNFTVLYSSMG